MKGELLSTPEAVRSRRGEWLELVARHGTPGPGSDPDHLLALVRGAGSGARPHVYLRPGRALVAGMLGPGRELHRVGYSRIRSPRLNLLEVAPLAAVHDGGPGAVREIRDHFRRALHNRVADVILVGGLALDDPLLPALRGLSRLPLEVEPRWRIEFAPGPFAATMARHSGVHRKTLRRSWRQLAAACGDYRPRTFSTPEEVRPFLDLALPIAAQSWQSPLDGALTDEPRWREPIGSAARHGRFRGVVLEGGGLPLAYVLALVHGDRGYSLVTGYRSERASLSPGTLLLLALLEDLHGLGCRVVDLGIGTTEQKSVYGTHVTPEATVRMHGPGAAAQASLLMGLGTLAVRQAYRGALGTTGLERVKAWLKAVLRARGKPS